MNRPPPARSGRRFTRPRRPLAAAVVAILLAGGCAIPPQRLQAGATAQEVGAALGDPVATVTLPGDITRRFYRESDSIAGTWRADFGPEGRLIDLAPATTSFEFAALSPGVWLQQDVLQTFGPAERTEAGGSPGETRLVYRFRQNAVRPAEMVITLDAAGRVVRAESIPVVVRPSHR